MIDITMKFIEAVENQTEEHYRVSIGPDGHVCRSGRSFYVANYGNRDEAWAAASAYRSGAWATIEVAFGLASRFLKPL